eukprot:6583319-Prorocentrum_lima.AAC.1
MSCTTPEPTTSTRKRMMIGVEICIRHRKIEKHGERDRETDKERERTRERERRREGEISKER